VLAHDLRRTDPDRRAERDLVVHLAAEQRVHRYAGQLAGRVVHRQVDGRPGEREAVRHRRAEPLGRPLVEQLDVERCQLQQDRGQVPVDHHRDRLGGLVAPAGERSLLSPPDHAVLGGQLHEHHRAGLVRPLVRAADGTAAEHELPRERHRDGEHLDRSDPRHRDPPSVQAWIDQEDGST
jgi:hypothetical protein